MNTTNNNIIEYVEGLELEQDKKYIVSCGIEFVYDPASRNRTNQYFDLNMIVEENNGAFWIIRRN